MKNILGDVDEWDSRELRYRAKGAAAVLLSLAILIGGIAFASSKALSAWHDFRIRDDYIGAGTDQVTVVIPRGATTYQISDILAASDVVRSPKAFDAVALNDSRSASIQPGHYTLRREVPAKTALDMLLDPRNRVFRKITVVEGKTLQENLQQLAQPKDKGGTGLSMDDFQKVLADPSDVGLPDYADGNAEGFLFPDTYEFGEDGSALEVLQVMTQRFQQVSGDINLVAGAKAQDRSPRDVVIVASIIEREVHRAEDRPKVARVLYNRLDQGWPLQLDSTVHYAVNKPGNEELTPAELRSPSPYNTYTHSGLPPGPISNPGREALLAALGPAEGEWMYFTTVNNDTGETLFEVTDDEHNVNVARYQQWCRENVGKC